MKRRDTLLLIGMSVFVASVLFLGAGIAYSEGEPEPTPKPTPPGDCALYDTHTQNEECSCSESMCGGTYIETIDWACNGKCPEGETCVSDEDGVIDEKLIRVEGPCDTKISCVRGSDCGTDVMQEQRTYQFFFPCHCEESE